jgi:hypothetical protein
LLTLSCALVFALLLSLSASVHRRFKGASGLIARLGITRFVLARGVLTLGISTLLVSATDFRHTRLDSKFFIGCGN